MSSKIPMKKKVVSSLGFGGKDKKSAETETKEVFVPTEEAIIKRISDYYSNNDNGLIKLAHMLAVDPPVLPQRKITVLILGNHSAGKSSYINWYIGDEVQKTGVAIETQHFTLVTHGKKRETLSTEATLKLFPSLNELQHIPGALNHLITEVSPCTKNQFPMVNFIDSPGLMDSDSHYDFDIDRTMRFFADYADVIFVFYDPVGQALCQRTMAHVEDICMKHKNKVSFWLSKTDLVEKEADRMKILQQIIIDLARRPSVATANLTLQPIYVPGLSNYNPAALNQIEKTVRHIDEAINMSVQNILKNFVHKLEYMENSVSQRLDAENWKRRNVPINRKMWCLTALVSICGIIFSMIIMFIDEMDLREFVNEYTIETPYEDPVDDAIISVYKLPKKLPVNVQLPALCGALMAFTMLGFFANKTSEDHTGLLKRSELTYLNNMTKRIKTLKNDGENMYKEYISMSLDISDM